MSRIYPYLYPNDFVVISRPTGIGSNTEDGIMPVGALLSIVSSGTWEAITSDYAECSNAAINIAFYTKIGNIVNCTLYGTLDFSSTTTCSFIFTLPFTTTDSFAVGVTSTNIGVNGLVAPNLDKAFLILNTGNQSGSLNFSAVFTFIIN
jgi:hypothetical protein